MANRSYLYACNNVPGNNETPEKYLTGLSETNYDIPLAYKILLSPSPRVCRSRIWNTEEAIAIVGDFDAGLAELTRFLGRITLVDMQPDIDRTLEFLHKPENKAEYLLLECGEIFDMSDNELGKQNALLLKKISALHNTMEQALITINTQPVLASKKRWSLFPRKPARQPASDESLHAAAELGLKNWSNILYFDFSTQEQPPGT